MLPADMETFDAKYNRADADAELAETRRVAAKLSTPTPTWVYTWYEYGWAAHPVPGVTPPFVLNRSDMVTSYKRVAEQGAAGVVMWGSSNLLMASRGAGRAAPLRAAVPQALPECNPQLAEYVRSRLGPYIREVTANATACGSSECSGHGRCVRAPGQEPACDCFAGWTGPACAARAGQS